MMRETEKPAVSFGEPVYDYGNRSPIEVIRLRPVENRIDIDPHASLEHPATEQPPFTEAELRDKVIEIADNYQVAGDPQFGLTVANKDRLEDGQGAILVIATSGSSLYDEERNPNNEGNALELAYTALKYPESPVVYVEAPGNGNSSDMTKDEYVRAARDGRLVDIVKDHAGRVVSYEAFETVQAMAQALQAAGIPVERLSANASGAHFGSALETALPPSSLDSSFMYNPTNISDRSLIGAGLGTFREILTQRKYSRRSHDPLRLSVERKEMAREVMGSLAKRKLDQARASTHNPAKLIRQQQMFRRGNRHGQAAAVQAVAAQLQQPDMRQTIVFPEFAAQYKRPEDFYDFMEAVQKLGGTAVENADLESLQIPLGQYGHSHFPTVRQTLESHGFNR